MVSDLGAILWPSASQDTQPQNLVDVDWSNPLTNGLCFAVIGSLGAIDLVSGKIASTWNGKKALKRQGVGLNATGAGTGKTAEWSFSPIVGSLGGGTGGVTLLSMSNPFAEAREGLLIGMMMSGTPYKQIALYGNLSGTTGTTSSGTFCIESYNNTNSGGANSSVAVDGGMHVYAGVYLTGVPCKTFVDGVNTTGSTTGTAIPAGFGVAASSRISIGNEAYNTTGRIANATFPLSLAWNRALTDAEIAEVSANPWRLFTEDTPTLWFAAAGAGGAINLDATAAAQPTATAALTTAIPLAASASSAPAAAAALATQIALQASTAARPASSATLVTGIQLLASATAMPAATATLTAAGQAMSAAAGAQPSPSATLSTSIVLAASAAASPAATAVLTAPGQGLAAASGARPSGAASLTTGISLSAAERAAAAATATLLTAIQLSASTQARAGGTASLSTSTAAWVASNTAQCIATANLTTQVLLAAAAGARPAGTADLQTAAPTVAGAMVGHRPDHRSTRAPNLQTWTRSHRV
ncbi:MAG: hypothetical protein Q7U28_08215 [Aquabacterium sp.]|nr:hypothetical protein [Aquabacterium sp.]